MSFSLKKDSKIYIAGHTGLLGRALVQCFQSQGFTSLCLKEHRELDLCDSLQTRVFFEKNKIDVAVFAAGKVGGISANQKYQADFLKDNLSMSLNFIQGAADGGVKKLMYVGSSCVYPANAPQPISERALLTGPFEPSNEGYAVAKVAGLKLTEMYNRQYQKNFISCVSANFYGPYDHFNTEDSHVIPALFRRFHEAKKQKLSEVSIWGSGKPIRDFLFINDAAEAILFLLNKYDSFETLNIGTGVGNTISELAHHIQKITGYAGKIVFDASKPDGMLKKVLDTKRVNDLGWKPRVTLEEGLRKTYEWAVKQGILN